MALTLSKKLKWSKLDRLMKAKRRSCGSLIVSHDYILGLMDFSNHNVKFQDYRHHFRGKSIKHNPPEAGAQNSYLVAGDHKRL